MVSISEKANSSVKVRAAETSFVVRNRENFPEVGGRGPAWPVDLPIPTVRRHSLPGRSEEPHIGRAVFSDQEDQGEHPRNQERPGR